MKLLAISPDKELVFPKPGPIQEKQEMKLTSLSDRPVAFKVKTTAPKSYLVRPSFGVINPKQSANVEIILQSATTSDNTENHRFLVQAAETEGDVSETQDRKFFDTISKEKIQEHKMSVQFTPTAAAVPSTPAPQAAPSQAAPSPAPQAAVEHRTMTDDDVLKSIQALPDSSKLKEQFKRGAGAARPQQKSGFGFLTVLIVFVLGVALGWAGALSQQPQDLADVTVTNPAQNMQKESSKAAEPPKPPPVKEEKKKAAAGKKN